MSITIKHVENLFKYFKTGENKLLLEQVAENVEWTVMGTHPLAGSYHNKQDFISGTFERLNRILKDGVLLKINNILGRQDAAVMEMESLSTALNGIPFNNAYCWIVKFRTDVIVQVRTYVDSALVQKIIDENEGLL